MNSVAEVFNRFGIPQLFAMNPKFQGLTLNDKLPQIIPGHVTAPSLEEIGKFISDTTKSGYLVRNADVERELSRLGGFAPPSLRRAEVESEAPSLSSPGEPLPGQTEPGEPAPNNSGE